MNAKCAAQMRLALHITLATVCGFTSVPFPPRKMKIHIPHGVNVVMGHTRMTTQGNAQFNQNNHPFLGKVDGSSFALAHNGVL